MANTSKRPSEASSRRKSRVRWLLVAVIVAAVGATVWTQVQSKGESEDPNVLVNLTSRVGKQAPSFTLSDSEGRAYTVAPGDGRKYVLIFHMGSV